MTPPFPFDPDIRRASTIPARLYIDPEYLTLEEQRVFGRTWQLVGRADQVAESGQYITAQIGPEEIVVVRDGDTLRAFHNICLHRAGPVAQGCGKRQTLQCRYHGWTYRLDGSLLRAPEMERPATSLPAPCTSCRCRSPAGGRWYLPTSIPYCSAARTFLSRISPSAAARSP